MFQGSLFTSYWLREGICETDEWRALDDALVRTAWDDTSSLLSALSTRRNPNEAETEEELVYPLIELLGWEHKSVQQNLTVRGRKDVPDALLFLDADADARARELEPWQRFRHGAALVEAKRWGRQLDREGVGDQGVPSTQIMHYLRRAGAVTDGSMPWGILTNGRHWRLYYQDALSVAEDFFEIDLGKIFGLPDCSTELFDPAITPDHAFRLFLLIFGRRAFLPSLRGNSFHLVALEDARKWEEEVRKDLAATVFDDVFPLLIGAIPEADPAKPASPDMAYAEEVRQTALFLLYRLLFVLYAEDRNLLPDEHGPYATYCLTRLRQEIAERHVRGEAHLARSTAYWSRLETIFSAIAEGDDDLGIPPYNGGLFDPESCPQLARIRLSDEVLAKAILPLSHHEEAGRLRYINYRDLSVQQLGSIYESILEYGVELDEQCQIRPREDNEARHRSGSYYTPEPLVSLIIEKAVGPLVEERLRAFEDAVLTGEEPEALAALDPAMSLLSLRIVDPAMGSGHFLVSLVDWLSDKVLTAIGDAEAITGTDYHSPLVGRIAALRESIVSNAREHRWPIVEEQLDDRHIVRRMVLKRCIHGVDLNPMAVELAKVALWLHSFTVGAPLSFLDHHLRHGNSVLGAWVRPTMDWLQQRGSLIANQHLAPLANVVRHMEAIEDLTDTDLIEVHRSKELFETVAEASRPLDALISLTKSDELMGVMDANIRRPRESSAAIRADGNRRLAAMSDETDEDRTAKDREAVRIERAVARAAEAERKFDRAEAMKLVHEGTFGDPSRIASGEIQIASADFHNALDWDFGEPTQASLMPEIRPDDRRRALADQLVQEARSLMAQHSFFNWEIAFPGVWNNLTSTNRSGGFDAVIGNPPYVRQEEISSIKPALAKSYSTYAGTADLYVYFYEQATKLLRPGGRMGFVVTNKWLRAGYAEELRRFFAEDVWIEFLADFGHARHLFPDADVHPCIITIRKPTAEPAPQEFDLAVIPRDEVPRAGLAEAVESATYRSSRSELTGDPWDLEPPEVAALLRKLRSQGSHLEQFAGVRPYRGILTGLNEAFLIDTATRNRIVQEDAAAADIIKPYLRGQDISRWMPEWAGLWMIVMKSSSDHAWPWARAASRDSAEAIFSETYPALHRHMKAFESYTEEGKQKGLRHRLDQGRFWWELRPCAYYDLFNSPKIVWQAIQYYGNYAVSNDQILLNNKAYLISSDDPYLLATLNSPLMWWVSWRHFPHMKDEALSNDGEKFAQLPIAEPLASDLPAFEELVSQSVAATERIRSSDSDLHIWLKHEFGLLNVPLALREASALDYDGFVSAVRNALPRRHSLTPAQVRQLRDAFADSAEPARTDRLQLASFERSLAAMVERAFGLTEEEVALMWRTAPPRMPYPAPY